ncbi:MAG: hypothetical protein GY772_26085, partial [bacterium]|nr:hypothetical protein [bacterium]
MDSDRKNVTRWIPLYDSHLMAYERLNFQELFAQARAAKGTGLQPWAFVWRRMHDETPARSRISRAQEDGLIEAECTTAKVMASKLRFAMLFRRATTEQDSRRTDSTDSDVGPGRQGSLLSTLCPMAR